MQLSNGPELIHNFLEIYIEYIGLIFDTVGVLLVTWGGVIAILGLIEKAFGSRPESKKKLHVIYRADFASKMILALEFFLAVDIIKTVVSPTFEALGKLGALVVIRTVLNYFLNNDVEEKA